MLSNYNIYSNEILFIISFKTVLKLIEALDIVDDDKIKHTDIELDLLSLKNA